MSEDNETNRPSFSAPLKAAFRQGTKEIAQILPAFPDSIRPVEEPGTLGNPTSQMVTNEQGIGLTFKERAEMYASREVDRDDPEQEMER